MDKTQIVSEFMDNLRNEMNTRPKDQDCSCTLSQVSTKVAMLEAEVKGIFNRPEPKPKVEEPLPNLETAAEGDNKADSDDVEMKDEAA